MRVGNNPEKDKGEKNILKPHRVVVVFYVPESNDIFFSQLDQVLDKCLESLTATVSPETTNITLINNCSSHKTDAVVEKYRNRIDKYVVYSENKGKVYAVLNEVRATYEEFVTVADSDILFFGGWENAVFNVFANHPNAGVVSPHPCPYTSFYYNKSVFGLNSILGKIEYGKYVDDADIDLYVKGTNLPKIIERKGKYNWKEKQFRLKEPIPVIIGAYHVVATYRTQQFRNVYTFPEIKFRNSYEEQFIDCLADQNGMYRLSTPKSYIYHMGNTIDDVCAAPVQSAEMLSSELFSRIKTFKRQHIWLVDFKRNVARLFIKFKWNL